MTIAGAVFWGVVLFVGFIPIWLPIFHAWEGHREKVRNGRQGYRRIRTDRKTKLDRRFLPTYTFVRDDDVPANTNRSKSVPSRPQQDFLGRTGRYGHAHKALRAAWKDVIKLSGAECMEQVCLLPSRSIDVDASWDSWDLAHNHELGGTYDYLGPAHKVCNQAEALNRGVTWDGAPTYAELMYRVRDSSPRQIRAKRLATHASGHEVRDALAPWDDTYLWDDFDHAIDLTNDYRRLGPGAVTGSGAAGRSPR